MTPYVRSSPQTGFTILELMIASSIFAVILLVVAVGVVRFGDDYYKGITSSKTQFTARSIISEVSQTIEFGKTITIIPTGSGGALGLCVDNMLYSYKIGQQITDIAPNASLHQGYHGLIAGSSSACSSGVTPSLPNTSTLITGSRELLGQHMRLGVFTVSSAGDEYTIRVRVIYGDDDLLRPKVSGTTNWANEQCANSVGEQFCAISDLSTTVERRLL
jgi:prepilin-type N-terminal cleavage/methylation domain-containing protein